MEFKYTNNLLPIEILEKIYKYLSLSDLKTCLDVCSTWQRAGSSLYEYHIEAKRKCEEEFGSVSTEAYNRAKLSWPELYNSLKLWANIGKAKVSRIMSTPEFGDNGCSYYAIQCLKDGVISYVNDTEAQHRSVTYLDTEIFKSKEVMLDLPVYGESYYKENDDLIVCCDDDGSVHIITKPNYKVHRLPEKCNFSHVSFLKDLNKVFYVNNSAIVMVSIVLENEETILKTETVMEDVYVDYIYAEYEGCDGYYPDELMVLGYKENEDGSRKLLIEYCWNCDYSFIRVVSNGQVVYSRQESCLERNALMEHGFVLPEIRSQSSKQPWTRDILKNHFLKYIPALTRQNDKFSIYNYGNIIFCVTRHRLHIYDYNKIVDEATPATELKPEQSLEIDLRGLFPGCFAPEQTLDRLIKDIKVIEIPKGHRLIINHFADRYLGEKQRILSIEFSH